MPRAVHEYMIGNELAVVLIGRCHIDLISCLFALFGKRTNDIVRFEPRHLEHGNIHRFEHLLDHRHGLTDIFGCLRSLRFVLLVRLMAERPAGRVKSNTYMGRLNLTNEIIQRDAKTEDSRGILTFAIHSRRPDKSVVRAEDHGVRIDKKELVHITIV